MNANQERENSRQDAKAPRKSRMKTKAQSNRQDRQARQEI
jgi:hypothetical protein